nr:molybdopterin-dependent oxidoreductase [Candidatus Njordarchaeum guaymaensis]
MPRPIFSFIGLVGLLALPLLLVVAIGYAPASVTPNADFFTVSIDGTPQINVSRWSLVVEGRVDHRLTFTYANLTAEPNATEVAKLQCVDGPSGTAAWTGIPLNSILAMAGVQLGAMDVVFYGADGYTSSLTWPTENKTDVLLAFAMNGEPLPPAQGFPLRVVAPNELGYKWVKWVYRIEVVNYDYKGYWESRGFRDNAGLRTSTGSSADWRIHAILLSVSFLLGGLAAVSGAKLSPTMAAFDDLPAFVSRRFHIVASVSFLASAVISFTYWVFETFPPKEAVFYTFHGIVGLFSIGLLVVGALKAVPNLRRPPAKPSWHGKISLYGFTLFAFTILLGFVLTAGIDILARFG